jgi:hypothetical protein
LRIISKIGGVLLWGASAAISIFFFYRIANNSIQEEILAGILAVGFEIAKIALWQQGGFRRALSIPFILLSLFASMLAVLGVVDSYRNEIATTRIETSLHYESIDFRRTQLQSQIRILTNRLEEMPRDWPTRAGQISTEISELRLELANLEVAILSDKDRQVSKEASVSDVFYVAATYINIPVESLLLVSLLLIAVLTEIGAIALFDGVISTKSENNTGKSGGSDASESESPDPIFSGETGAQEMAKIASGESGSQSPEHTSSAEATPKATERIIADGTNPQISLHVRIELHIKFLNALTSNGATKPGDRIISRDEAARKSGVSSHKAKKMIDRLSRAGILYQEGRLNYLGIEKDQAIRIIQRAR